MITWQDIKVGAKFRRKICGSTKTILKIRDGGNISISHKHLNESATIYYTKMFDLVSSLNDLDYEIMNQEKPEIIEIKHKGRKIKFNLTAAEQAGIVEIEPEIKIYDGVKYKDFLGNHFSFSEYADEWFRIKDGKITNCIGDLFALKNFIEHNSYILVEK